MKSGGTYYKIANYIKHKEYFRPVYAYDIAVMKVDGKIKYNDKVKPIELLKDEVKDGVKLQLTGWGLTKVRFRTYMILFELDRFIN